MTKQQRLDALKKLAGLTEGQALKEHFEELIGNLTDSRNFSKEDFEIEGKASLKAAIILQKILRDLELLRKPKVERKKAQYL